MPSSDVPAYFSYYNSDYDKFYSLLEKSFFSAFLYFYSCFVVVGDGLLWKSHFFLNPLVKYSIIKETYRQKSCPETFATLKTNPFVYVVKIV